MRNIKKLFVSYPLPLFLAVGVLVISATIVLATDMNTGVKYPGTVTTNSEMPYDDENWTSSGGISADGGSNAKIDNANFDNNDYSHILRATNFDFSAIPADATIQGVKVEVERKSDSGERGKDAVVQLTKDGVGRVGDNKADTATEWPTSFGVKTYGGSTDLWGTTWTPSEIQASAFGVHLAAQAADNDADIYVDFIRITVYYDAPQRTITASAGAGGAITPSGAVAVNNGSNQAFSIVPNSAYIVADILVDAISQGKLNSYTFNNIIADYAISASFDGGWSAPSGSVDGDNDVGNDAEAFTSNNLYTDIDNDNDEIDYTTFGLTVPAGSAIDGIEVALEGSRETNRSLNVSLSWNGGANFTSIKTLNFAEDETTIVLGSSSDTWGRSWSDSEFSNANFRIRLAVGSQSGDIDLDQIQVKVHYTVPPGHIVVDKVTDPSGDLQVFSFDAAGGVYTDFGLADADIPNDQTLAPGNYSVSETVPGGWEQSSAVCVSSLAHTETIDAIELDSGETITCTFTNIKNGHLIVQKTTYPASDATQFPITASGTGTITGGGIGVVTDATDKDYEVAPGTYSVAEDLSALPLWQEASNDCDDIEVGAGETETCTIVNKKAAHITVTKTTVGGDGTFHFSGLGGDNGFDLNTTGESDHSVSSFFDVFVELDGTDFSVTEENAPTGWDADQETCALSSVKPGDNLTCAFTNTKRASFSLEKFSDPEEGEFQFDLTGPAQTGIPASHSFTPSGTWDLDNLLSGIYSLSETILAPLDWTGSQAIACSGNGDNDPSGSVASPFGFTLNPGDAMSCTVNNTKDALISGKKFEDMNADGIAGDDSGIAGWTITATVQDNSETVELESGSYEATTDNDGDYTLQVQPGTYYICETGQNGWTQSYPVSETAGAISCDGGYGYGLTVLAGGNTSGNDFGNYQNSSISGYKLEDADADGDLDEDETALDEWTIFLDTNDNGVLDDDESYQETGAEEEGYYYFGNLIPGTYIVREVLQSGWMQTYPGSGSGSKHTVIVTSGEDEENQNFGNFELVDITGFKWDDTNGDGVWQKSCDGEGCVAESGKQDIIVGLGRQNGDPIQKDGHEIIPIEIIAMDLTGNDGGFVIHDVAPGHYKLFEEKKSGWSATNPAARTDSFFDITYDIKAIGDPDFDLLRIGDPDFDLLRDSFFDVFVELSGQTVNQSEATRTALTTIPSVPLEFGNHKLLVINQEEVVATETKETSTVIAWITDFPGTSRVVYDTVSHPVLGSAPNYGYANSTAVFDESPKVTNHSVSISGLSPGTTYYYRTISAASPESVGGEGSFGTPAPASSGGGGGSSGGGGGGGGGIIILPGTSQPETNETSQQQSGSEPAGSVFAAVTTSGIAASGVSVAPSVNEIAAPVSEESETIAVGAENIPDETVETVVTAETALAPETESSSAGQESFLAAAIGVLSFGTQSTLLALGTALAFLILLTYGGYWLNQKKYFRKR